MKSTVHLRAQIAAGILAGIVGGILFELVFAVAFRTIDVTLLGPTGLTIVRDPALGITMHFAVAIAWALGYVYAARSQPQLALRPWISGAGYGTVVYVCMQIVLLTAGIYRRPPAQLLFAQLLAHIVFYGIPVAFIVSRAFRTSDAQRTTP